MQYNWYKKELAQKLEQLRRIKASISKYEKSEVDKTIQIIESVLGSKGKINFNLPDKIYRESLFLRRFNFLIPLIDEMSRMKKFDTSKVSTQIDLKNSELIDLTHEFFKKGTDLETLRDFEKIFKRGKNVHFITSSPEDFYADSLYLPYFNDLFVQMRRKHQFRDLSVLSHEYGHGIQFSKNYNNNLFSKNVVYREIVSTFFELTSHDYFSKMADMQSQSMASLIEYCNRLFEDSLTIISKIQLYSSINEEAQYNKIIFYDKINELLNSETKLMIEKLYRTNSQNDFLYIIGFVVALELFLVYLKDKDKAFYLLRKVISLDLSLEAEEYYLNLLDMGLMPGEHYTDFEEYIHGKTFSINCK